MDKAKEIIPLEDAEQEVIFYWAKLQEKVHPELKLLFAVPNGGQRNLVTAVRLKATGVKSGVPDMILPVARGQYHGMFIELKRRKGGQVSINQKQWLSSLSQQGYYCVVAHGSDQAITQIQKYLNCEV